MRTTSPCQPASDSVVSLGIELWTIGVRTSENFRGLWTVPTTYCLVEHYPALLPIAIVSALEGFAGSPQHHH